LNALFGKRRFAFRVGDWSVDPQSRELVRENRSVRLEPLTMKLLLLLIGNRDRITPRSEILEKLWNRRIVTDDAFDRQLAKLRAALGDGGNGAEVVETLPKTGLRLVLPVTPLTQAEKARFGRWLAPAPLSLLALALVAGIFATATWVRHGGAELVDIRPLSSDPGEEIEPALTRDGRFLAFAARRPGEARFALYVRSLGEDSARRMTPPGVGARHPAWSPAGDRLAFFARTGEACTVMVGSAAAARFTALATCSNSDGGLTWLDEDRLIVADRARYGAPVALRLVEVGTRRSTIVTQPAPDMVGDSGPLVSGEGSIVYFVRSIFPGVDRLERLDLDTGTAREIGGEAAEIRGIGQGRNGHILVSATRRSGLSGLWDVDAEGGEWVQVAPVDAGGLSASADGGTAIFEQSRPRGRIWQAGAPPGPPIRRTDSTGYDHLPSLSPDRSRLAFISNRSGAPGIWLKEMGSGAERRLPLPSSIAPAFLAWAPNGQRLAVSGRGPGGLAIFNLDLGSGRLERLPLAGQVLFGSFSADGGRIYFSRLAGGRFAIFERDLTSGRERRIVENAWRPVPLGGGAALLFVRPYQAGLWRIDLGSGAVARISAWPQPGDRLNWAASSTDVWVPDRRGQRLLRLDPDSGAVREARPLPALNASSGLSASGPDLLFSLPEEPETDLMLLRRGVNG